MYLPGLKVKSSEVQTMPEIRKIMHKYKIVLLEILSFNQGEQTNKYNNIKQNEAKKTILKKFLTT